jgi:hypothetical protein
MHIVADSPVPFKVDAVTGFLLTTAYKPDAKFDFTELIYTEKTVSRQTMNHPVYDIDAVYPSLTEEERVPFYW